MELTKYNNHRSTKYLNWLRNRPCVISGQKAECTHHIRLGTNGGTALKPSDYFCIPLLHEFHTVGPQALHIIGEDSFLKKFNLNKTELFVKCLSQYLIDKFDTHIQLRDITDEALLEVIVKLLEEKDPFKVSSKKNKPKKDNVAVPKVSITQSEFYQKAKELKRIKDKEIRAKLKAQKIVTISKPLMDKDFYEKAKEAKRVKDRKLRDKNREKMSQYRKEQYKKMKELKRT